MGYDRYNHFRNNGTFTKVPTIKLSEKDTDYFERYRAGFTRLDLLSYEYYSDPNYDWLILMANPDVGSMEFSIPDGYILRIPYPLSTTLEDYDNKIQNYERLYGLD